MTRFIFGLGTGRCGTMSLARLLDIQEGADVTHESLVLPWSTNQEIAEGFVAGLERRGAEVIGDVAFYLLPYAEMLMDLCPGAKLVVMCRDQRATVASYMRKTPGTNHWQAHGCDYAPCMPWDQCYPKYPRCLTKPEAIAAYWEDYYAQVGKLARRWPDRVKLFATEDLNQERSVAELLHWLGFQAPVLKVGLRANQGP